MSKVQQFVIGIFVILFVVLTTNSCKKYDSDSGADATTAIKEEKERIKKSTMERYGSITGSVIAPIRQAATSKGYIDKNGKFVSLNGLAEGTNGTCGQYTCATAPSASDLYTVYNLDYIKWYYTCGVGHDLTATWSVSVPYTLLLQHPGNSTYSFGNIKIMSGSTTLATSGNLGSNNFAIKNLGTDPNCSSNTLYQVTYTWHNVSDTYFPGNTMEAQMTVYNNCSITNNNHLVSWLPGPAYSTTFSDLFEHPCDRVDQAFVNPPSAGITYASVTGDYSLCTPPWASQYNASDHEVEYRAVDNSSSDEWVDQSSTVHGGVAVGTSSPEIHTIDVWGGTVINLLGMTASSGKWLVRYRNRATGCATASSTFGATWVGPWFMEVWNL